MHAASLSCGCDPVAARNQIGVLVDKTKAFGNSTADFGTIRTGCTDRATNSGSFGKTAAASALLQLDVDLDMICMTETPTLRFCAEIMFRIVFYLCYATSNKNFLLPLSEQNVFSLDRFGLLSYFKPSASP